MPVLPIILPLLVAALLAAGDSLLNRRVLDVLSTLTALAALGTSALLVARTLQAPLVYWLGNWRPLAGSHFPIGICLVVDPLAAGMAVMVSLLVLAGFVFSWRYFDSVQSYYHALVLVFLGAMNGLCLTGDLFNLFVFFELMTAAAVGLCGYKAKDEGPLQGALNLAVVNTLGAFLTLIGIALVYAYTGSLNMAQAGAALAAHPPPGFLVPAAFVLVIAGFLTKAAAVPFHFWLADAHAVAPVPISVLFSGVMVELGLYAVFRLYASTFAQALAPHAAAVRILLLTLGTATVVIGGILCLAQRHLKRLLAYSTISHMGLMFLGLALLTPEALGGTAVYLVGHGLTKGALFLCAGLLLHHFQTLDEGELRGRGRRMMPTAALMLVAALGLAGVPPFATAFGESLVDKASRAGGQSWIRMAFAFGGVLTAAAVLRVVAHVFWGLGEAASTTPPGSTKIPESPETGGSRRRTPPTMWLPAAGLLLLAMVLGIPRGPRQMLVAWADRALSSQLYQDCVLHGAAVTPPTLSRPLPDLSLTSPVVHMVLAAGLLGLVLYPHVIPRPLGKPLRKGLRACLKPLRRAHSGRVGDYVAWLTLGLAAYGLLLWVAVKWLS